MSKETETAVSEEKETNDIFIIGSASRGPDDTEYFDDYQKALGKAKELAEVDNEEYTIYKRVTDIVPETNLDIREY